MTERHRAWHPRRSASSTPTARGRCAASTCAIAAGERVAIIGQNGSGKSTLVRHLNGLLRPTAGASWSTAADSRQARRRARRASSGMAFQNPDRQIFAAHVRREVALRPAQRRASAATTLDVRVTARSRRSGSRRTRTRNPYDLGFSRRKLLALASVLAMETPVVVLDEPTTGQDARGVERVRRIVAELPPAGRTVIAISHDMRFVAETFERVIVYAGRPVVLDGTPAEVFGEPNWPTLASTFLEPPLARPPRRAARPRGPRRRTRLVRGVRRAPRARVAGPKRARRHRIRHAPRRSAGSRSPRPVRRSPTQRFSVQGDGPAASRARVGRGDRPARCGYGAVTLRRWRCFHD